MRPGVAGTDRGATAAGLGATGAGLGAGFGGGGAATTTGGAGGAAVAVGLGDGEGEGDADGDAVGVTEGDGEAATVSLTGGFSESDCARAIITSDPITDTTMPEARIACVRGPRRRWMRPRTDAGLWGMGVPPLEVAPCLNHSTSSAGGSSL